MAEQKTKPTSVSVDEWLASIEDPIRRADAKTLVAMLGKISGEKPVMWGVMVGFGQYHYKYESGTEGDTFLIGFAARKAEFALYLHGAGYEDTAPKRDALLKKLGKHKIGKGCLYVKKLADVDQTVLAEIAQLGFDRISRDVKSKTK
jgi:hypothetical protein